MNPAIETQSLFGVGGTTVGTGGTVLGSANVIDWSPTYEPSGRLCVNVGGTPSGTLIARFLGGTASGDTATVLGVGTLLPGSGGTQVLSVDAFVTSRYVTAQLISTGGTVLASAHFQAKPRLVP